MTQNVNVNFVELKQAPSWPFDDTRHKPTKMDNKDYYRNLSANCSGNNLFNTYSNYVDEELEEEEENEDELYKNFLNKSTFINQVNTMTLHDSGDVDFVNNSQLNKSYPFGANLNNDNELLLQSNIQLADSMPSTTDDHIRYRCFWIDCNQTFTYQIQLVGFSFFNQLNFNPFFLIQVTHIEYCHIDPQRYCQDNYTCYWLKCPREFKSFNARYKLLNHMRIHSGEKPNKCPVIIAVLLYFLDRNFK